MRTLGSWLLIVAMATAGLAVAPATPAAAQAASDGPACASAPDSGVSDVAGSVHADAIDCVLWWRIAAGYPDGRFRPGTDLNRAQMGSFIATTILAADASLPEPDATFPDVGGVHARAVHRLAAAGIVNGRRDGTYGPAAAITRGQMAVFLTGAAEHVLGRPLAGDQAREFRDVEGHVHRAAIEAVAAAGIAQGDTQGRFNPDAPVTRGQLASFLARLLEVYVADGIPVRAAAAAVDQAALDAQTCPSAWSSRSRADQLMAGDYRWAPHPTVHLGTSPSWDANPFDRNWRFQFHAMRWLWPLLLATQETGDPSYQDHAVALARDWVANNPVDDPADFMAWDDHAAAWRSVVFTCIARLLDSTPDWLADALDVHGRMLADPDFYVAHKGNHALNQNVGLLAIACTTEQWQHRDLGLARLRDLLFASVDAQGVTNEQSVEYQSYNYERYIAATRMLTACGLPADDIIDRLAPMPEVLAHLTLPNGDYATLGDTDRQRIRSWDPPAMRWMYSGGEEGAPPDSTFAVYDAGFAAARTGWGTAGAMTDESLLTARFGPRPELHGHDDHGSLTLFGDGQRLLTDPGKYAYRSDAQRVYVTSRQAHNLVTVGSNTCFVPDQPSQVSDVSSDAVADRFTIHVRTCEGTSWLRSVAFLRDTGDVIVVDDITAPSGTPVHQRWQLEIGATVDTTDRNRVTAQWSSDARLLIEQLGSTSGVTAVSGASSPVRGWVSPGYGEMTAAPNLAYTAPASSRGTVTRFVTVLRPGADAASPASTAAGSGGEVRVTVPTGAEQTVTVTFPPA